MAIITPEQVAAAYAALATGQRDQIVQMWAEDMRWLVPGHNQLSGWKNNVDEFIAFMARSCMQRGRSIRRRSAFSPGHGWIGTASRATSFFS